MKRIKLLFKLLLIVMICIFLQACGMSEEEIAKQKLHESINRIDSLTNIYKQSGITIKGVITNLGDLDKNYLTQDSYLQLVFMSEDGQLSMTMYPDRGISYNSELMKIPIPNDGFFIFHLDSLEPGKYIIVAQGLLTSSRRLNNGIETKIIEILPSSKLPLVFDLGNLTIQLPHS